MHYGRKNYGVEPSYSMYGEPIEEVCSGEDLGVMFSNDMKVALQCNNSCSKANRMLGLIRRTIKYRHPVILLNLYKSLVRPHLDYCSSVWNTYSKDIELLERVQHRFTRLFSELRSLPYEVRLCQLGLWSLEERRNRTDPIEVFKLVKGFLRTAWNKIFHQPDNAVTVLPEVIVGNWRRITATATPVFSSSLSVSSTVGIVCLRRILKSHQ